MSTATTTLSTLKPLRDGQRQAAVPYDNAWVSASAGTGKTQVLTARVLRLLLAGAAPERILCLTFTKAAAAEMQTRIYQRLAHWVRAVPDELAADLDALGAPTDAETIEEARRLFARALDSRGGLRIQTLHSFAQSLLASFPIEAGVAPGFSTLDDRSALELRARVLAEALTEAEAFGDDGFSRDIGELAIRLGEQRLASLAGTLIRHREGIATLGVMTSFEPWMRRLLGLPTDGGIADVMAAALTDTAFDCVTLREFALAMGRWGTKTGLQHADVIAAWLRSDSHGRVEAFGVLHAVFFTDKGEPRKFSEKLLGAEPSLAALADKLCADLRAIRERRDKLELARIAAQHLRVGSVLGRAYQTHKNRSGTLDFDDMIVRAARLLDQDGIADWVRFKLDQGVDHILVDEAQDTNEHQWTIVRRIAEEFFAGLGARETSRTLFVVGDFKQSIFSFQGSDPRVFEAMRDYFGQLAADAQLPLHAVPLSESFRSTPAVLAVVDKVIERVGASALGLHEEVPHHRAARGNLPGAVTLWPALRDPRHGGEGAGPSEQGWMPEPQVRMAQQLAMQIRRWLDAPLMLESKGRPLRPEDILVLVRQRGDIVTALVAALHAQGVPVAGVDRLRLTEPLAVQDLLALVRFVLQPDDDLTLATLLVSPFLGWSQDALFDLAHGRDVSLWRQLRRRAERDAQAALAADWLGRVLALADLVAPYEFFETVLSGPLQGRARLLRRLGEEARDSIDEVLSQALAFEGSHAPSLQGFLAWIERDDVDLKRDPEAPVDAVRIMTVHGSKGLQAPVVVLADATRDPSPSDDGHVVLPLGPAGEEVPLFYGTKAYRLGPIATAAADADRRATEEHWRLLYVALTRAEDLLFVGGALGRRSADAGPDSWHRVVEGALIDLDAEAVEDDLWGETLVYRSGERRAVSPREEPTPAAVPIAVPDWAQSPPAPEAVPPKPLAPSHLAEDDVVSPPPAKRQMASAKRGQLLHQLFERLPAVEPAMRAEAARAWLSRQARDLPDDARDEIAYTALTVIEDPAFEALFGADALAEAPIAAVVGTSVIAGKVDRLLITPDLIRIVDFKTGLKVPETPQEVAPYHLSQMAAYVAALSRIFPGRAVEAALLFTEVARLMPLPPELLAAHAPPAT